MGGSDLDYDIAPCRNFVIYARPYPHFILYLTSTAKRHLHLLACPHSTCYIQHVAVAIWVVAAAGVGSQHQQLKTQSPALF